MDKATLHEKLDAYLKGSLDAAEQAEVRQLIDSDKDVADQLELVRLEQELAEVIGRLRGMSWYLFLVQAHFAMALLKSRQAKTDEAVSHLRAGFGLQGGCALRMGS